MGRAPVLFVGESWLGSSARSLRDALVRQGLVVQDWNQDLVFPHWKWLSLRLVLRVAGPGLRALLRATLLDEIRSSCPRVLVAYKGTYVDESLLKEAKRLGVRTVNVYPDCSPLAFGGALTRALASYDLVVSTKPWHPSAWQGMGFPNECRFLAHGYDPLLHRPRPEWGIAPDADLGLIANYRAEYGRLVTALAGNAELRSLRFVIFGARWPAGLGLPRGWTIDGPVHGHAYVRAALRARVMLAPVTTEMIVAGRRSPGDQDSTRTYELPAIGVPMVHRRTDYVRTIFREGEDLLLYDSPAEAADNVLQLVRNPALAARVAGSGHNRVVPRDSLDVRAAELISLLEGRGWL